jgi:hypothetical protein
MSDPFEDFLNNAQKQAPSEGPSAVTSGSGEDEFSKFLNNGATAPKQQGVDQAGVSAAINETPGAPSADSGFSRFLQTGQEAPGYMSLFTSGLHRGYVQAKAAIPSLQSVAKDLSGDTQGAIASAQEAQQMLQQEGDSYWELKNVKNIDDFLGWSIEKLGEQGVNIAAMMATGGTTGAGVSLLTKQLLARSLISQATAKALVTAGTGAAAYATSTGLETAGTTQEQFDVTGKPQAGLSLAAGATKGLLELWTPMHLLNVARRAGVGSVLAELGKTAAGEGLTEYAQELIDIAARKYSDPSYSFFGDGPDWWNGPGFQRALESGVAGAVVGGVYGGVTHGLTAKHAGGYDPTTGEKLQKPGDVQTLPGDRSAPLQAPEAPSVDMQRGPVSVLRDQVLQRPGSQDKLLQESLRASPRDDLWGVGSLLQDVQQGFDKEKLLDLYEAATPRYAEIIEPDALPQGISLNIQEQNAGKQLEIEIQRDGQKIGRAYVRNLPSGLQMANLELTPENQRKGVMTAVQRYLERKYNKPAMPDETLSEAEYQRWKKNDEQAVYNYRKDRPTDQHYQKKAPLSQTFEMNRRMQEIRDVKPRIDSHLRTDTEIELDTAMKRPQSERPRLLKVDQSNLQPAAMTATVFDLPAAESGRLWFLPGVGPEEQAKLTSQYNTMQGLVGNLAETARLGSLEARNALEKVVRPIYDKLLKNGLRVIPSRGSGFYYDSAGTLTGTEVNDLATTGRVVQLAMYDPVARTVTPFFTRNESLESWQGGQAIKDGGMLVSIDANKIRPGDVVFPEGMDPNKPRPFILKEPLRPEVLTPGIRIREFAGTMDREVHFQFRPGVHVDIDAVLPRNTELGNEITKHAKAYAPAIEKLLKDLGLQPNVIIIVTDDVEQWNVGKSPAFVVAGQGAVYLVPENMRLDAYRMSINPEVDTLACLMHEVGHIVTYYHFNNAPTEIQQQLVYAWDKANLAERMGSANLQSEKANTPGRDVLNRADRDYYLTFPEWMAEQFRRWSTSKEPGYSYLTQFFKQGADKLERFYKEWEGRFGKQSALDLQKPDYAFTAWMDYLRDFSYKKASVEQLLKQQAILSVDDSLLQSEASLQITSQVRLAISSMEAMFPEPVRVSLREQLSPHLHQSSETAAKWNPEISLIELAIGSLRPAKEISDTRMYMSHELMHAYLDLGLITKEELVILDKDIAEKPDRLSKVDKNYRLRLRTRVQEFAASQNAAAIRAGHAMPWNPARIEAQYQKMVKQEEYAYYIQDFADTAIAQSTEARDIMSRLMAVLERIRNFLQGLGFQTRDDIIRAFFKGEMAARYERTQEAKEASDKAALHIEALRAQRLEQPTRTWASGDMTVQAFYDGPGAVDYKKTSKYIFYHWLDPQGNLSGVLEVKNRLPKGYEIAWIESDRAGLGMNMLKEAERDLGQQFKVSGELTADGRKQAALLLKAQGKGELIKLWQQVTINGDPKEYWVSPNWVLEQLSYWSEIAKSRVLQEKNQVDAITARERVAQYKAMAKALPQQIYTDGTLDQMFSLRRNYERDEVQGSLQREGQRADESKLLESLGQGSSFKDNFSRSAEVKQQLSQAENARASGLPVELSAPSSMLSYEAWNIRKAYEYGTGYGESALEAKEIKNLKHEADRIGWFTKKALAIAQLAHINPHIIYLQKYNELQNINIAIATRLMRQADETARVWNEVPAERKDSVAQTFFDLSEMNYRDATEVNNKMVRPPANWDLFLANLPGGIPKNGELDRLFKKYKLSPKEIELVRRVSNDFMGFLDQVEAARKQQLAKTLRANPPALATALAKLATEMQELRAKPYFPMVRFGEFTLSVRDPAQKNKVVYASAYDTQSQRTQALPQVRAQFPGGDIIIGRVPESTSEFMGLPLPLLRAIREDMPLATGQKLTPEQTAWMEQFEMLHAPDRSFRKRWMPSKGTPGHSMDAFRAYAHYFQNGARYLARLSTMDDMQEAIHAVENSITGGALGNTAKRQQIVQYMRDHFRYVMEPGRDSVKFRSFFALYHLGFSPAAAFMNLTQIPGVLIPKLSSHFGVTNAYAQIGKTGDALKASMGYATGNKAFEAARNEMISQGRISIGQASELAAFADGYNLDKLNTGTRTQKWWRKTQHLAMTMFSATEHYNREFSFKAAWDLALKYPNNPVLKEIDNNSTIEIGQLTKAAPEGPGLSHNEAVAFLYARQIIDDTQFQYNRAQDAPFMRGPVRKDFLIFFKYMQNMLFALRYSGAGTHMLLVMAFLYGLGGLPGADELNELLRLLGNKLFGKDFDLKLATRRMVREATKGTIFDEVGPDVAMNGVSRYGFGLGLLPQSWGMPSFDASANGSMGRLVPGLSEFMHSQAIGGKFNESLGDSAQRAAGAGYGSMISLMHFMMSDPLSADQKQWEQIFPRSVKSLSKALRFSGVDLPVLGQMPGAETTKSGAKIVKFDITDPNDLTTVLTQAAGFTPTKVSETWDLIRASREVAQVAQGRRTALYAQADKAIRENNSAALDDVKAAILKYNEDVAEMFPSLAIKNVNALVSALKQRAQSRELQEQFLAPTKREVTVTDRMKDLFPGIRAQPTK